MDDADLQEALKIVRQVVYQRTIEAVELALGQPFDRATLHAIATAYDVLFEEGETASKRRAN